MLDCDVNEEDMDKDISYLKINENRQSLLSKYLHDFPWYDEPKLLDVPYVCLSCYHQVASFDKLAVTAHTNAKKLRTIWKNKRKHEIVNNESIESVVGVKIEKELCKSVEALNRQMNGSFKDPLIADIKEEQNTHVVLGYEELLIEKCFERIDELQTEVLDENNKMEFISINESPDKNVAANAIETRLTPIDEIQDEMIEEHIMADDEAYDDQEHDMEWHLDSDTPNEYFEDSIQKEEDFNKAETKTDSKQKTKVRSKRNLQETQEQQVINYYLIK